MSISWSIGGNPTGRSKAPRRSSSSTGWPRTPGCGTGSPAGSPAGHPVVTVDLRGHGRSSKPDDGYDVADRRRRPRRPDRPAGARPPGRGRPVMGRQCRARTGRRAPRRDPRASSASTAAGWSSRAAFPDWEACRAGARAAASGRAGGSTEVEGYIRSAPRRLAGERDPGHARQLRGPAGRHDRAVADLRPAPRRPARPVGPPAVASATPRSASRSCLCPAEHAGSGRDADASGRPSTRPLAPSRTPESTGSSATTTSTPSIRARSADLMHDRRDRGFCA